MGTTFQSTRWSGSCTLSKHCTTAHCRYILKSQGVSKCAVSDAIPESQVSMWPWCWPSLFPHSTSCWQSDSVSPQAPLLEPLSPLQLSGSGGPAPSADRPRPEGPAQQNNQWADPITPSPSCREHMYNVIGSRHPGYVRMESVAKHVAKQATQELVSSGVNSSLCTPPNNQLY